MKFETLMASIFYIVLVIAIVAVVAKTISEPAPTDELVIDEPSQDFEITVREEPKVELPEFYPAPKGDIDYVKGFIIDPYERPDVVMDVTEAKESGANLITIPLHLEIGANQTPEIPNEIYFDWKSYTIDIINEAHRQGLNTELRLISSPGTRLAPLQDYDNHLSKSKKLFVELSKFANEYQIYQFTIYEQIDNNFNFGPYTPGEISRAVENITVESIKPWYKGKIGLGFTYDNFVTKKAYYNFRNVDYVLVSVYPNTDSLPSYHPLIQNYINRATLVSYSFGVEKVILGGFGVNTDLTPPQYTELTITEPIEVEFYREVFDRYENQVNGITVHYDTEMFGIKDHKALEIVSENFKQ